MTRLVLAIALALASVGAAACGAPSATPAPTPTPGATATPVPSSPVEGIVVKVETSGLNDFRGFQLRMDGGEVLVFVLGRLENATEFPPSHLPEHMAASDRLRVSFRQEGADLVAYRIEHGEGVSPPAP